MADNDDFSYLGGLTLTKIRVCVVAWVCMMCTIWNRDWGTLTHLEAILWLSWTLSGLKNETFKIVTILAPELRFRVQRGQRGSNKCFFDMRNPSKRCKSSGLGPRGVIQNEPQKLFLFLPKNIRFHNLWFYFNKTAFLGGQGP